MHLRRAGGLLDQGDRASGPRRQDSHNREQVRPREGCAHPEDRTVLQKIQCAALPGVLQEQHGRADGVGAHRSVPIQVEEQEAVEEVEGQREDKVPSAAQQEGVLLEAEGVLVLPVLISLIVVLLATLELY